MNRVGKCTETQRKASEVAESLLTQIIEIYVLSAKQQIDDIQNTKEFTQFELATAELQKVTVDKLSTDEKLCFWINIYNLMNLHCNILSPPSGTSMQDRLELMSKTKYEISGHLFSTLDIEFGILRNKATIPDVFGFLKKNNFFFFKKLRTF